MATMEHLFREGFDNQLISECGSKAETEGDGICSACVENKNARRLSRAEAAKKAIAAKEEKMSRLEEPEIFD